MKKIAYLISQYPAISHTFILRELIGLQSLGLEVVVASINATDRPVDALTDSEKREYERTFYIKKQGVLGAFMGIMSVLVAHPLKFWKGLFFALKLARFNIKTLLMHGAYIAEAGIVFRHLKRNGCTHCHSHFCNAATTILMIVSKMSTISYSFTLHGPTSFANITPLLIPEKLQHAKFVLCISYFAKSQAMSYVAYPAWPKLRLVRQAGVDTTVYLPKPLAPTPPKTAELLYVGRLSGVKGAPLLIQAIHKLKLLGRSIHLKIIGDGDLKAALETQIDALHLRDCVTLLGRQNQDAVHATFLASDIFVFPSFQEGLPTVLIEAMALGVPCVTTHIMGTPELIQNQETGILIAPSCPDQLVAGISQLLDDWALYCKIATQAREKVVEMYDATKNVALLHQEFKQQLPLL